METDSQYTGPDKIIGPLSVRAEDASPEALRARILELEQTVITGSRYHRSLAALNEKFQADKVAGEVKIRELEARLAAGQETIESVDELFDLPETVVYRDSAGYVWEVVDGELGRVGDSETYNAAAMKFPVRVIYNPYA
ncbi:hypothetical protein [Arthrobacter sp. VKM Ac-2550]|uniref:hypothetical protein n=1 Tax=Crystallibacter permensis TaxID=1938888 RepID=UPI002227B2DB|nr:hypothetical protein [Arthrobacter sp. VKM Ac-2550]